MRRETALMLRFRHVLFAASPGCSDPARDTFRSSGTWLPDRTRWRATGVVDNCGQQTDCGLL